MNIEKSSCDILTKSFVDWISVRAKAVGKGGEGLSGRKSGAHHPPDGVLLRPLCRACLPVGHRSTPTHGRGSPPDFLARKALSSARQPPSPLRSIDPYFRSILLMPRIIGLTGNIACGK